MDEAFEKLTKKKKELDTYRPLPPELVKNLEEWLDVELTYTSNAIEGNTLTRLETALVIEKGITVEGKSLREHLEAINHKKALEEIRELAKKGHRFLEERDILNIHALILKGIDDEWAGRYRQVPVRISGSDLVLPNCVKVPSLMKDFTRWLTTIAGEHPVKIAADAHYKLVSIHPWVDGNGRTSRLLMDLILIQAGFPPAIIQKEERRLYFNSLKEAQMAGGIQKFYDLMIQAEARALDIYLNAAKGELAPIGLKEEKLLKIGQLAKTAGISASALRFYVGRGLIAPEAHSEGGFMLFKQGIAEKIKKIKKLQREERLSINAIRKSLEGS
ncbi:Fic family protein [Patescibacteria group bacterium]|nr:Fic family protein [Patescibacteria group bacterium]MCL5010262.1 Fic family protein [Patescibacteria group bacterium]